MNHSERAILTSVCMVYGGSKILVENGVKEDWSSITFPGGRVERGGSIIASTIREIKEEIGLDTQNLEMCGIKQFFDDDIKTIVFLYKTNQFSGVLRSSREGKVFWIEQRDLKKYQLADGFADMLKVFENDKLNENRWYLEDGQ